MQLSEAEKRRFDEEGYLFFPELFSPAEAAVLRADADRLYALEREEVVRESDGTTVRTVFAATASPTFSRRSPATRAWSGRRWRFWGGEVYIHQFKVNAKAAFDGDVWQCTRDYGVWSRDDHMPEPAP